MKILKETASEDCFSAGLIKEYKLDSPITASFLDHLRQFGELTVMEGLATPYFTFDKELFFTIKGLIGKDVIKVIYRPEAQDHAPEFLQVLLENCGAGQRGLAAVIAAEKSFQRKKSKQRTN